LAKILIDRKEEKEVESLLLSALQFGREINSKQKVAQCHLMLSELYKKQEKPWQVPGKPGRIFQVKSEVAGEESTNKIKKSPTEIRDRKSDQEAEIPSIEKC